MNYKEEGYTIIATSDNDAEILERIANGEDPETACKDLNVKIEIVPVQSLHISE